LVGRAPRPAVDALVGLFGAREPPVSQTKPVGGPAAGRGALPT